jgi:hypothetical protein
MFRDTSRETRIHPIDTTIRSTHATVRIGSAKNSSTFG